MDIEAQKVKKPGGSTGGSSRDRGVDKKTTTNKRNDKRKKKRSRKKFGDRGFTLEDVEAIGDASWLEVCQSCFAHTPEEWVTIFFAGIMILACLYFFGLGLDFLGTGAKVAGGCAAGELFGNDSNPISGLMTGILATVLLQSSSTTTAIIVGLVGADDSLVSVQQGIYMVMGANIGTTVTSTIVALGHFHDPKQLELAFGGATVHDVFNFLSVAVLLPVEVVTGYLNKLTAVLVRGADTESGDSWKGPIKRLISPLAAKVLVSNKKLINAVAAGGSCDDFYPIECSNPANPTKKTCGKVGLIACDKTTGLCPAFFQPDASLREDQISGFVVFFIGLFVIFFSLFALVHILQRMLLGVSARVIYKATNLNGYLLIALGTGITMMLQSSSTTTSFITPVVGMGALGIEQMYPITIGANIGTTLTSLLAAVVTDGNDALQVALAHLMFNITGMMIWYPIPFIRRIPVTIGRRLGTYAKMKRSLTLVYLLIMYVLVPLIGLGLSAAFTSNKSDLVILASVIVGLMLAGLMYLARWCYCLGGRAKTLAALERSSKKNAVMLSLSKDMESAQKRVIRLKRYAMLAEEETSPEIPAGLTDAKKKTKKEALEELPDDIAFVFEAISTVMYHIGMPDDPDSSEDENEASGTQTQEPLLHVIPKAHLLAVLLCVPAVLVALALLYTANSTGLIGLAAFLSIMLGLCFIWCIRWWYFCDGRQQLETYYEKKRKQNAAIDSLSRDMFLLKSDIQRLLSNYKLRVEVEASKDGTDDTDRRSHNNSSGREA